MIQIPIMNYQDIRYHNNILNDIAIQQYPNIRFQWMQRQSSLLHELQNQLKKQYLLLEREQKQKAKKKQEIEKSIQQYYSELIANKQLGKLVKEDKLGNCYNFVKDLVISVSKDVRFGFELVQNCEQQDLVQELTELFLGILYDSYSENDPYLKKDVKFSELLAREISKCIFKASQKVNIKNVVLRQLLTPNLQQILKQYLKLQKLGQYFEMIANRVINKIPLFWKSDNFPRKQGVRYQQSDHNNVANFKEQRRRCFSMNELNISTGMQQNVDGSMNKYETIVNEYKLDIIAMVEMMPICLRVLCYVMVEDLQKNYNLDIKTINKFIWEILEQQYKNPFEPQKNRKWDYFQGINFSNIKFLETFSVKIDDKFQKKLIQKIIKINSEKFNKKQSECKKKIIINGGCISYLNMFNLFSMIKQKQIYLKDFNERITNRANKIHEMHPKFQYFQTEFKNPDKSYLVFIELVYGQIIQKDYQSIYSKIYSDDMIKNMLKQILSDSNFHILPYIQKGENLFNILKKINKELQMEGEGNFSLGILQHSPQFNMKIKYLWYLMKEKNINEESLFKEMISQCEIRHINNMDLFEKNKLQLLQCLTTVNNVKRVLINKKEWERKVDLNMKIIKYLDEMKISLCITGPSLQSQKEINKFTNTKKQCQVKKIQQCENKQHLQEQYKYHGKSAYQIIQLFCNLKQVRGAIKTGKDNCKILECLQEIIKHFKQQIRNKQKINMKQYSQFQNCVLKIVMRKIHELLIQNKQIKSQIQLEKLIKDLSFIKLSKIKMFEQQNLVQLEQIWQIACRYLKNLNNKKNVNDKMQSMVEMIEVIKKSFQHIKYEKNKEEDLFQIILVYCIIHSKPQKILSNINFIQLFLSKEKLMTKDGSVLERLKRAVSCIKDKKIIQILAKEDQEFQDQFFKNQIKNCTQTQKQKNNKIMKLTLRNPKMIGYI